MGKNFRAGPRRVAYHEVERVPLRARHADATGVLAVSGSMFTSLCQ
jgi:hypothetical protein